MRYLRRLGLVLVLLMLTFVPAAHASSLAPDTVPAELERWQPWVLHGHEASLCPGSHDDGTAVRCQWPARLEMNLSGEGGTFEQRWQVFAEGWAALPGEPGAWPESVVVNGRPVAVISRNQRPVVHLMPGEHRIAGRFFWSRMPETIGVPPTLGLVSLMIDGRTISAPRIDEKDRLWLRTAPVQDAVSEEGSVQVTVFRLLEDTIPLQVTTVLRLDVSGMAREIELDGALIPSSIPMALDSPLPARMDSAGRLTVQARAGRWEVRVRARMVGPQHRIHAGKAPHGDEIWSFQERNALRMVEIAEVPPVDPHRTEMPQQWRRWPAYLVQPQSTLVIRELRRGDPDPAPDQLFLQRTWWLDFDGSGLTVHDTIHGTLSRQWFLAVNPPLVLGRVADAGIDQVITAQGAEGKMGLQLRRSQLSLSADSRLPQRTLRLSAVDWNHDFQSAAGVLQLPPGWRLLAASGVDRVSDTWLQRWSLLDLFLVLIIALAVLKLRGPLWGVLALSTMVLIYHEPNAPRLVLLHLIAVLALLPLLPDGWFKRLVSLWGIFAMVLVLVVAVPYALQEVRWGLHPQLALPHDDPSRPVGGRSAYLSQEKADMPTAAPMLSREGRMESEDAVKPAPAERRMPERAVWPHDPDALVPTGPGLPDWRWHAVELSWRGPVTRDHTIALYLLSPHINLALALIRVVLLGLLIGTLIEWRSRWGRLRRRIEAGALVAIAAMGLAGMPQPALLHADSDPAPTYADTCCFPPPELLATLRERLLAKPDCLPDCADISRMEVRVAGDELQIMLKVNSAAHVAVPLPVSRKSWLPSQVLLNNAPISGLAGDASGRMWALVPAGLHTLVLLGEAGGETVIQLPLPLPPRTATYTVQGWRLDGIHADGSVGASIQLTRLMADDTPPLADEAPTAAIPPFLQVERLLRLGLTWQVVTTVTRLTPTGTPIVLTIPLLDNESVTTEGIRVQEGRALVDLAPDQRVATFTSGLETATRIDLRAPLAVPWTESWVLEASAIWHFEMEGLAVVSHLDAAGQWRPQWRPWPGEQVTLHIQRPPAIPGQLMTIDGAILALTPGQRLGQGALNLTVRTHRAGRHTLELPPRANLQAVTVNGRNLPIRQDGPFVTVPIEAGTQQIGVQWQQLAPFQTMFKAPAVGLSHPAVNARVTLNMPGNRWILMTGGPDWGPAVLFWSYLVLIVLIAAGLGRLTATPLKTRHWLLLGLGLTQIPTIFALLIVGWLLVLGWRSRQPMPRSALAFNTLQIGLVLWTAAALYALFAAVKAGLLGMPEMQIAGNHSTHMALHWIQDRIDGVLPQPWVFSLPLWVFRVLMLAWSLWLALALLDWLKWGWRSLGTGGRWRKPAWPRRKPRRAVAAPTEGTDG
jgi:hypothetical protein